MTTEPLSPERLDELPLGCCGDNRTLPARIVGCGVAFRNIGEIYRCTHCDVPFHKQCADKHFRDDTVLTEEHIDNMSDEEIAHAEAALRARAKEANDGNE